MTTFKSDPIIYTPSVGTVNITLSRATTTNAFDSVKVTGASGALSASNPGYVRMLDSTGNIVLFTMTSDVTLLVSGAPFGYGGKGDRTASKIVVYAINDSGTLKIGAGTLSQYTQILQADSTTTPSAANFINSVVVNSELSGNSPAIMIGTITATFDDTGGTIEDQWTFLSGIGAVRIGQFPIAIYEEYSGCSTLIPDNTTTRLNYNTLVSTSHGTVTTGVTWQITIPITGLYEFRAGFGLGTVGWSSGEQVAFNIYSSDVEGKEIYNLHYDSTINDGIDGYGTCSGRYTRGDLVNFRLYQNSGGGGSLTNSATKNWVSMNFIEGSQ